MKRYIRLESSIETVKIEVIFDVELDSSESTVAAATYKGHEIPEGKLSPADKKVIVNSQVWAEYQAFIESIEDMLEAYDLHVYYKNKSAYDSFYWNALAKDDEGNDLIDFTIRMRVSTHPAHRTSQSQKNKKAAQSELAKVTKKKKITPIFISVVVNDESEKFDSYLDVIVYIDEKIEHALEIMTRRNKK